MLTYMVDIGFKTGLWEAAAQGPATSQELAERAGLEERYVREWLAALACGGVFQYDPARRVFTLPPEHAVCLTGGGPRDLAARSQMAAMLASRLPKVAECFRKG